MTSPVLVINSGSSSIKYSLIDVDDATALASGIAERIGQDEGSIEHTYNGVETRLELPIPNHQVGLREILNLFTQHGPNLDDMALKAVGHRVVQGGPVIDGPVLITDDVEATIERLSDLAPLHNPANLEGIRVARAAFPDIPHVGVFDTAFHHTLAPEAYTYAIDRDVAEKYLVRRFGAHGTSHKYVSEQTAQMLGKKPEDVNVIVLHIGNGASITAVRAGKSAETSMGLTPLEGLVMGTRSGDIDPAVVFHLQRVAGMDVDEIDNLLNKQSGLVGLTGSSDLRDVHASIKAGDKNAELGLAVYCHRIKHYLGAYFALLGHVDAITFTAGVGENDGVVRAKSLEGLESFGIALDEQRNATRSKDARLISTDDSPVKVFVIPTNEELEIARQAISLLT